MKIMKKIKFSINVIIFKNEIIKKMSEYCSLSYLENEALLSDTNFKKEIDSKYKTAIFEITKEISKLDKKNKSQLTLKEKNDIDTFLDSITFPSQPKQKYSQCLDFLMKYSV